MICQVTLGFRRVKGNGREGRKVWFTGDVFDFCRVGKVVPSEFIDGGIGNLVRENGGVRVQVLGDSGEVDDGNGSGARDLGALRQR